jgi:hypothetical protein
MDMMKTEEIIELYIQYLNTYGKKQNPSEDGRTIAEILAKAGAITKLIAADGKMYRFTLKMTIEKINDYL